MPRFACGNPLIRIIITWFLGTLTSLISSRMQWECLSGIALVFLSFLCSFSERIEPFFISSGHIAERMNLRTFLFWGCILSGATTAAFGLGYFAGIHDLAFYLLAQVGTLFLREIFIKCLLSNLVYFLHYRLLLDLFSLLRGQPSSRAWEIGSGKEGRFVQNPLSI